MFNFTWSSNDLENTCFIARCCWNNNISRSNYAIFKFYLFWSNPNHNQNENKKDICKNIVGSILQSTHASVTTIMLVLEVISQLRNTHTRARTHTHTSISLSHTHTAMLCSDVNEWGHDLIAASLNRFVCNCFSFIDQIRYSFKEEQLEYLTYIENNPSML